ncbi:MAG: NAD-dependent epimerase/dehydratase family protein [Dehalococcoidales bacterium]|nr:NAD-dependent epimerase/dehydratase family protein [Dehalococcoidales bacterium]
MRNVNRTWNTEIKTSHFVTGGAGFIGSHLVDWLMKEGNRVTAYDNLTSGRKENIKQHFDKENFRFIEADLLDFDTLKEAMKGHEIVWHLGANTDIPGGNRITDLDLKNCTIATWNVLEAMKQLEIDKILFTSSATVYGDAPSEPLSETFGPLLPISLYGAGKLACEGLITSFCHLFDLKAWIFRFANVVGARMSHGVIFDFIHKLRKNPEELEILGDGNQEKPFFLVEDCIEGMLIAFQNSTNQYDIYNLGCDSFTSITKVAQIVAEEMNLKNVRFKYTGGKRGWPGDVPVVHFSVEKMNKLGWQAKHSSDEAVRIATRRLLGKT